ncbi:hypothetical protein Tco_1349872 [Tanacetum coccineum]
MFDENVVGHIANVLEILDLIKIPNVDTYRLCMKVFPLSLDDDGRQWWIDEGDGKITTSDDLVEKFFCKFYSLSRDGEDEMLNDDDNVERDYLKFISQINGSWHKELIDDIVSSDEKWEESDYGDPPKTNIDSFFKPYLEAHEKNDIGREDELRRKKRKGNNSELEKNILNKAPKSNNMNDKQPIKRVYKAEMFKAIKSRYGVSASNHTAYLFPELAEK